MGKEHKASRRHKAKQYMRKARRSAQQMSTSQEVSLADVHQAILNKINKPIKYNRKRTKNYNYNKLQQKHRLETVSHKLLGA